MEELLKKLAKAEELLRIRQDSLDTAEKKRVEALQVRDECYSRRQETRSLVNALRTELRALLADVE